jgi:dTDP-glucose 4,6-dehydratase
MRVLVTGAAGFLGSHMVERLLERGAEVVALDNLATGDWANLPDDARVTKMEHDASEPYTVDGPLNRVVHMASPASPKDFTRIPFDVLKVNSIGTWNALEVAAQKGARFLFASTSEVYGDPLISPQPETYWGNVNPNGVRSVYDESKRFGESVTMTFRRHRGVETRIVRYFNSFGPRMRLDDGRVVPTFVRQALLGEPLTVEGDGSQTRSFGYVDDSVRGTLALLESDCPDPVNIGSEHERSVLELAELVLRLTGSHSPIVHVPAAPDDPKQRRPDLTKARETLGYRAEVGLEDGLERTIAWARGVLGL